MSCGSSSSSISKAHKNKVLEGDGSHGGKETFSESTLWTDGLICAFELVRSDRKLHRPKSSSKIQSNTQKPDASATKAKENALVESASYIEKQSSLSTLVGHKDGQACETHLHSEEALACHHWVPIGWKRISELIQLVQGNSGWASQQPELLDDEDNLTVAELAAPYWEQPGGPTWWCHVSASHPFIITWLSTAQWLHPAISVALRDESRLISERMKYLLYEVPVRVAGGLLFELLGHSFGDPHVDEDDIPVVLRSWQAQNFLVTALHVKGTASKINVLGVIEVQELLCAGGYSAPRTVHELIAHLASRLTRWDDRLFRKHIFGEADEIELKFMSRRNHEDMNLFCVILNQEIRKLSSQVIRVKWSVHAREEIVFELLQHLRGNATRSLLEGIRKATRELIEEQEAVRGRLFTIQDVMQSTVRAWLQDKSLRVTHNLGVFGGCGLVLSIITGLFGINVDGIPGADGAPYAFAIFAAILFIVGSALIAVGLIILGLKKPISEEQVEVRMLELQDLVKIFQHEAETHAQVRKHVSRHKLRKSTAGALQGWF